MELYRGTTRSELQAAFVDLLGSTNVYFDPPESVRMQYPCILYTFDGIDTLYASDVVYKANEKRYQVMYIDRAYNENIVKTIMTSFKCISYSRHFVVDNLHHDVFYLYW